MRTHRASREREFIALLVAAAACSQNPATRAPAASGQAGDVENAQAGQTSAVDDAGSDADPSDAASRGETSATAGAGGDDASESSNAGGGATPAAAGASGEASAPSCDFKVTWSISDKIQTVGIVEWTSDMLAIQNAHVEFGLDTSYGMSAPVPLDAPNHHTLLVGMKPLRAYHFRVVASGGGTACTSDDYTLATGSAANGLPALTVTDHANGHAGGFFLSSFLSSGPAFMLDADGEYVWSYGTGGSGRAALSHDGNYVWYGAVNVDGNAPSMKRVTLDGLEETDFTADFSDLHHDFTLLPDDTIGFLAHHGDSDLVLERAPDGTLTQVLNVGAVLGSTHTHANSIHYYPADDSYTLSELAEDSIIKFGRDGRVAWIVGGAKSDFSGDVAWDGQHGHLLLGTDDLLFFSNGITSGLSSAWELKLDFATHTATRVWQYEPGLHCLIYGDVARLDNEDTLVTFSTLGVIHELSPAGELVRELTWALGGAVGYVTPLRTPYPPFD